MAAAAAGRDDGRPDDERITFPRSAVSIPVRDLLPTQREIDVDNSLAWQMGAQPGSAQLQHILNGRAVALKGPILTLNGGFVVDGHHRWSQVYCINPDATVSCMDIRTRDRVDPVDFLKAVQMAIAVTTRSIPQERVRSQNLMLIDRQRFDAYVHRGQGSLTGFSGMTEHFWQSIGADGPEHAASLVWSNVREMQSGNRPIGGAPERSDMPQTDSVLTNPTFRRVMQSGDINYEEPLTPVA